jgi:amino acid transporter
MVKAAATLGGVTLVMAETGRSGAVAGYLPRFVSSSHSARGPTRDILFVAIITSVIAAATLSPTLGRQFNALIDAAVVMTLAVYALCAAALWAFARSIRSAPLRHATRAAAAIALVFCAWVIASSGTSTLLLSGAILAATPLLWLGVRFARRKPAHAQ